MTTGFGPLPPVPDQTSAPPGLAGLTAGRPAPVTEDPMEAVRGILGQLLQATQIVMGVARQFPGIAEHAQAAADALQQMAAGVLTGAETGRQDNAPPMLA